MTTDEYNQAKNKKLILDFGTLNLTRQCLQQIGRNDLADTISQLLIHSKIEKPTLHNRLVVSY